MMEVYLFFILLFASMIAFTMIVILSKLTTIVELLEETDTPNTYGIPLTSARPPMPPCKPPLGQLPTEYQVPPMPIKTVTCKCRQCKHFECGTHEPPCKGCKGEKYEGVQDNANRR